METINQVSATLLLNAVWQIALVTLAAAVCAWLLEAVSARYRYVLWTSALLLSLILPAITASQTYFSAADLLPKDSPAPVVSAPAQDEIAPPLASLASLPAEPKTTFFSLTIPVGQNLVIGILSLYLLLVFYGAAKLLRAYVRTRAIARGAYRATLPESVVNAFVKCRSVLRVEGAEVLCSDTVPVPVTIGYRKPAVILPAAMLAETDDDVLTTAIGHELVHIRRRDYLFNLFFEVLYLPISFHPAAWLIKRRIYQARELCCDEIVAEKLLNAKVYARSLVTIAGSAANPRLVPATTVGITDAGNLEVRIMSLLKRTETNSYKKSFSIGAAVLMLAIPCVVAAFFAPDVEIKAAPGSSAVEIKPAPTPPADEAITERQKTMDERREHLKIVLKEVQESDLDSKEKELRTEKLKLELKMLDDRSGLSGISEDAGNPEALAKLEAELNMKRDQMAGVMSGKQRLAKLQQEIESLRLAGVNTDEKMAEIDKLRTELGDIVSKIEITGEARERLKLEMDRKMEAERLSQEARIGMDEAVKTALARQPGKVVGRSIERSRQGEVVYRIIVREETGDTSVVIVSGMDGRVIKTEKAQ
jgi:beta-lactamase regulating signal transducer with metallopeptidase domain/uncharacterized membrane protein YkoI